MAANDPKATVAKSLLELIARNASAQDPEVLDQLRSMYRRLDENGRAIGIVKHELFPAVLDASRSAGGWPTADEISARYQHLAGPLSYWARRGGPEVPEGFKQKMTTVVFYKPDKMDFGHSDETIDRRLDAAPAAIAHALMAHHAFEIDHSPDAQAAARIEGKPHARAVTVRLKATLSRDEWLVVLEDAMKSNLTLSDHREMRLQDINES